MGEIKPWQMIVIALAVIVLAFSAWRFIGSQGLDQPEGTMAVDVMTGQLWDIKRGRAVGMMLPHRHPETNERTLFPVVKDETTGDWVLVPRYVPALSEDLIERSEFVDPDLRLTVLDADPIQHVVLP
jgi:hypothetical protein